MLAPVQKLTAGRMRASPAGLSLKEMTWLDPMMGGVPGNEKTDPGNEIKLSAGPVSP